MRIEASNGGVDPGTPDSLLSVDGRGAFVELKVWPEPLQPMQLPWHIDAVDRGAGAEVWCWVGEDSVWAGLAEEYHERWLLNSKPVGQPLALVIGFLHDRLKRH